MKRDEEALVAAISHAARCIYDALGPGFVEQVYREAMAVEFRLRGFSYQVERNVEVFYKDEKVGIHRLDFIVEGFLVVELKAVAKLSLQNLAQTAAYLNSTELRSAMVINFPSPESGDGPEIEFVTPLRQTAARPSVKRLITTGAKTPRRRRVAKSAPTRRPGEQLKDMVWDDAARRYISKPTSFET